VKAIILAAGEGNRLRPFTSDRPKCMVEIEGMSLLQAQLEVLKKGGIEEVVLVGGYLAHQLKPFTEKLYINERYSSTNMVWSLFCAENELDGDLILGYGDIVYSEAVLNALLESKADISVAIDLDWESYWRARNEDPLSDAETLKLTATGNILEIGQKPDSLDDIEGQYIGLMKFSRSGISKLKEAFHKAKEQGNLRGKTVEKAYMTDLLQHLVDIGTDLKAVPIRAGWIEVDTVSDLLSEVTKSRFNSILN
jgi:choline kinase